MLGIFKRKKKKERLPNGAKVQVFLENIKNGKEGRIMNHTIDTSGKVTYIVSLLSEKIVRVSEEQVKKIK